MELITERRTRRTRNHSGDRGSRAVICVTYGGLLDVLPYQTLLQSTVQFTRHYEKKRIQVSSTELKELRKEAASVILLFRMCPVSVEDVSDDSKNSFSEGGPCGTWVGKKKCIRVAVENSEGQRLLGRPIRRWDDNELALKQREKNCKLD